MLQVPGTFDHVQGLVGCVLFASHEIGSNPKQRLVACLPACLNSLTLCVMPAFKPAKSIHLISGKELFVCKTTVY